MIDDLVAFLRARLDEDEREIRSILEPPADPFAAFPTSHQAMHTVILESEPRWVGGSYRMLVDIESKRRIIDLHPHATQRQQHSEASLRASYGPNWETLLKHLDEPYCQTCHVDDGMISGNGGRPCETLRLLAAPYAEHPAYSDEWRL